MRYIGVDLHTTQITVCYLKTDTTREVKTFRLEAMSEFVSSLESTDQIAVEATGNTRWFIAQVKELVASLVIVNPLGFVGLFPHRRQQSRLQESR